MRMRARARVWWCRRTSGLQEEEEKEEEEEEEEEEDGAALTVGKITLCIVPLRGERKYVIFWMCLFEHEHVGNRELDGVILTHAC